MDALFSLPREYEELRQSVRSLAQKEIAPHAKDFDEYHLYQIEAEQAL